MLVHFGTEGVRAEWDSAAVCVGTFDGVHLGHQEVIKTAVKMAAEAACPCVLVTFDRHPAATLAPSRKPRSVTSLAQNLDTFAPLGVAVCVVLAFDQALANVSAQEFLDDILVRALKARMVVVGHDFAMGKGRVGTTDWLAERIETTVVPPFEAGGHRVSSTEVRGAVESGDVEHAAVLLGRPFAVRGVVVQGEQLGRELGFPTANVARSSDLVTPADGVYACICQTPKGAFRAAVSVGVRPAVGGGARTIEAFLLDYPGDSLYGACVDLLFHARLREERDFADLEHLKEQIAKDVLFVASAQFAAP